MANKTKNNEKGWIIGIIIAIVLLILFGGSCIDMIKEKPDNGNGNGDGTGSGVTTTTISTPCTQTYPNCNGRCIREGDYCVKHSGYCRCEPQTITTTTTLPSGPCTSIHPSRAEDCYYGECSNPNQECAYNPFDNNCFCQYKTECGYHIRGGNEFCDGDCDDPQKSCESVNYPEYGFSWCDCYYPDEIQRPCELVDNPSEMNCLDGYCDSGNCRYISETGNCDCVTLCDDLSVFLWGTCSEGWCPPSSRCVEGAKMRCYCLDEYPTTTTTLAGTTTTTTTSTTTTTASCYDSDGSAAYYTKGYRESPVGMNRVWDHCNNVDSRFLYEMKCTGGVPGYNYVQCTHGCVNGACLISATTTTTSPTTTTTLVPTCLTLCSGYDTTYHGSVGTSKCNDWGMPYCTSGQCRYQCIYKGIDRSGLNCYCWNTESCNCDIPNNCDNSGCKGLEGICTDSDNSIAHSGAPGTCTDDSGTHRDHCISFTQRTGYGCSSGSDNSGHCYTSTYSCWAGMGMNDVPVCNPDNDYCYSVTPSTCNNMCQEAGAILAYGTYGNCGSSPVSGGMSSPYYFDIMGASDCTGGNPYCHCRKPSGYS